MYLLVMFNIQFMETEKPKRIRKKDNIITSLMQFRELSWVLRISMKHLEALPPHSITGFDYVFKGLLHLNCLKKIVEVVNIKICFEQGKLTTYCF